MQKKALAVLAALTTCWLAQAYSSQTYKFGIAEQSYPAYFNGSGASMNRVHKYNADYSWLTALPVDRGSINVEHLVVASDEDINRLGLPDGRYLFFSVDAEQYRGTPPIVTSITVTHAYAGEPLEVVGSYRFGKLTGEGDWKIEKLDGPSVQLGSDGFVRVYRFPPTARAELFPPAFWFGDELTETLVIETSTDDGPRTARFEFVASWHQSSSVLWQMLTVT